MDLNLTFSSMGLSFHDESWVTGLVVVLVVFSAFATVAFVIDSATRGDDFFLILFLSLFFFVVLSHMLLYTFSAIYLWGGTVLMIALPVAIVLVALVLTLVRASKEK